MELITALFVAHAAGGIFHSNDPPPSSSGPHYVCEEGATDIFTDPAQTLQLGTFTCELAPTPTLLPTATPTITPAIVPTTTPISATNTPIPAISGPIAVSTPAIGGPVPPSGYYCIDDVDPDMCDDSSAHLVPKGRGGVAHPTCGTVIDQVHKLIPALPQYDKGLRNALNETVVSPCGSTGPHSAPNYISTYFVIDAYNLAGYPELDRTNASHVSPSGMFDWWQTPPPGYEFIPYSTTVVQEYATRQRDLTGCAMFLRTSSSYHIGVVNAFELFSASGNGVISILQAGASMYIDRFPVSNWSIRNDSTNMTYTSGTVGFGCKV
jgi:hypothetical protein